MRGRPAPKRPLSPSVSASRSTCPRCCLPLHAEGGIGEHVVEGPLPAPVVVLEGVPREGVPEADVVVVLTLDEHVGLAHRPCLVVPVLSEEVEVRFRVEGVDVLLGHRQHAAGAAGRIVEGLDDVALAQIPFGRQQQVDHQLDHLARREVLPGLLVGLLRPDADELLEDVAHLDVVHPLRREVDPGETLHHLVEQVLLRHARDLPVEGEALHDLAHVGGESVDPGVQVGGEPVRVVQEPGQVELREVVEGAPGDLAQHAPDDGLRLRLDLRVPREHPRPGGGEQAVEAPQHRHRQDDLAVLVALVRPAEQVADAPDEAGEPGVGFGAQCGSSAVPPSPSDCAGPGGLLSTGHTLPDSACRSFSLSPSGSSSYWKILTCRAPNRATAGASEGPSLTAVGRDVPDEAGEPGVGVGARRRFPVSLLPILSPRAEFRPPGRRRPCRGRTSPARPRRSARRGSP